MTGFMLYQKLNGTKRFIAIIFKKLNRIFETTHENVYFCISLLKLQNLKTNFFLVNFVLFM